MSISVDRLRSINKQIREKIEQKSSLNSSEHLTIDIDATTNNNSLDTTSNYELLNEIPIELKRVLNLSKKTENRRLKNLVRILDLYKKLEIAKKAYNLEDIFIYKAMNISGIGLKEEDFGEIREGKYIQIIAITYEPDKNGKKKAKNISLGYFGKAETLEKNFKNEIIEFILRWRYEKAFQNLKHYRVLLTKLL